MSAHPHFFRSLTLALVVVLPALLGTGCPPAENPSNEQPCNEAIAKKWMKRAADDYRTGDLEDATDSAQAGIKSCPESDDLRILAARISLARLDFKGAVAALENVQGSEAASLRARSYWYSDDLPHTAEELSNALEDPDFKDPWAKPVRELSGTQGTGRHPFKLKEGAARLVDIKMPRDLGYQLMVPVEIDGQATTALAVTGVPEVILDSKNATTPRWVSIRFSNGDRAMEFSDVPALVQDLTPYTANQQVQVGALIGMNLLRRLHVTVDRRADQFIIRREEPPPPPAMAKVPVAYVRGGGMVIRSTLRKEFEITSGLWVDTGSPWSIALPDPTWKKLGIDPTALPTYSGLAHGRITDARLGGLDLGPVEAVQGISGVEDKLGQLDVDVMGAMGVAFWTALRVTIADAGRTLWIETDEDTSAVLAPPVPSSGPLVGPPAGSSSVAPSASAAPSAKPAASAKPTASASTKPTPKPAPSASSKPLPKASASAK